MVSCAVRPNAASKITDEAQANLSDTRKLTRRSEHGRGRRLIAIRRDRTGKTWRDAHRKHGAFIVQG